MSLHAGNPVAKTAYSPLYNGMDEAHDILTSCDVVVCFDLNLHESILLATIIHSTDRTLATSLRNVNRMNVRYYSKTATIENPWIRFYSQAGLSASRLASA